MLKDKLHRLIVNELDSNCELQISVGELVNDIIALVDSQRCVWTPEGEGRRTECGSYFLTRANFCPCCGKKIEVKEGL